jgi:hypothetical protein
MRVSRSRFRLVWLTLIAFSVQIGVAALHHHHDVNRGSDFAARAITAGICGPESGRPCTPDRNRHTHDDCVLCWASAIAANSLEPSPSLTVPTPPLADGARLDAPDAAAVDRIHRDHFRARAPPAAAAA